MSMKVDVSLRIAACAGVALLLPGCPNPNLYTTPRTLDPGKVQFQVAPEAFGATFNQTTTNNSTNPPTTQTNSESFLLPAVPTIGIRAGIVDGFELGARLPNFDSLGLDGKIRLVKGSIDLAVDPGVQFYYFSVSSNGNGVGLGVFYLHVPLLVGFNVSKAVTLVASPGFVYALASASASSGSNTQAVAGTTGVMGRIGIGVNVRASKRFSVQPELTFMKAFQDTDALMYMFGLGFNIGAQPDYSDLEAGEAGQGDQPASAPASAPAPAPAPAQ
jgi:hypothetical protein